MQIEEWSGLGVREVENNEQGRKVLRVRMVCHSQSNNKYQDNGKQKATERGRLGATIGGEERWWL